MHIADVAEGNLGANGIVGGGIPIAVGAALAVKRHEDATTSSVCFFGDGANNEGAFHEALNMAAIWKLPVVFVCENNNYGMSTSTERSTAVKQRRRPRRRLWHAGRHRRRQRLRRRRRGGARRRSSARARGEGPTLIECKTYRHRGHSKSDRNRYRTKEEIEAWIDARSDRALRSRAAGARHRRRRRDRRRSARQRRARRSPRASSSPRHSPAPDVDATSTRYVYADAAEAVACDADACAN